MSPPPKITFADASVSVQLGDAVPARLVLSPALDDVNHLRVALVFETAGSCDGEQAVLRQEDIRRDSSERVLDFSLVGPRWPPTYRGHLFQGRWFLQARTGDEVARAEVMVDAAPGPPSIETAEHPAASRSRPAARRWRRLVLLGLAEATCLAALVVGLVRGEGYWAVAVVVGLVLLPALLGTVLGLASARVAGELSVQVQQAGGNLEVRAWVADRQRVTSVTAMLVVREHTQRLAGLDNREHHEHVLHERSVTLLPVAAPDSPGAGYAASVPVPAYPGVPFTMSHSTCQVGWSLHVRAAIAGAPDQTRSVALVARPAGGGDGVDAPSPRWTTG